MAKPVGMLIGIDAGSRKAPGADLEEARNALVSELKDEAGLEPCVMCPTAATTTDSVIDVCMNRQVVELRRPDRETLSKVYIYAAPYCHRKLSVASTEAGRLMLNLQVCAA